MECKIALTGATGNMGTETLAALHKLGCVSNIKILVLKEDKARGKRFIKKFGDKTEIIWGDISEKETCRKLVEGVDYVFNLAAVIPPKSDKFPLKSEKCNFDGAKNIADAVAESIGKQPKLIHISTVALYGHRNYLHPWGRVGDPLLPSAYDAYAMSKLKGERYVLESPVSCWVVLRQTAILHDRMLADNMSDGLMFHTCYNAFLEWVTARDSGVLMARIIQKDVKGELNGDFWKHCYNIGGGASNRRMGYDTFDEGFKMIGGSTEKFMKPNWNVTRNFHGLWFYDGDILETLFGFQRETVSDFWRGIFNKHKYYAVAKILPPSLISKLAIQRLLKDDNAPAKWEANGDEGRIHAYFGGRDEYEKLPKKWEDFPLVHKGLGPDGMPVDFLRLRDRSEARLLKHGYDESKPESELDLNDMQEGPHFAAGAC